MKGLLLSLLSLWSWNLQAASMRAECFGPEDARRFMVYLHGFEAIGKQSGEERENREILMRLAKEHSIRIALPGGPVCPKNRRCWPAKTADEVLATFASIKKAKETCFQDKDYDLVGFSNGGYFAFKIYKIHDDPRLKRIIASSSSGLFDPAREKPNPLSEFHLMIGDKDITRREAKDFMDRFQKVSPRSQFLIFPGGHRLDGTTLKGFYGT